MCLKIYNLLGYKEHGFCYRKGAIFNENEKYQNSCQYFFNGISVWIVLTVNQIIFIWLMTLIVQNVVSVLLYVKKKQLFRHQENFPSYLIDLQKLDVLRKDKRKEQAFRILALLKQMKLIIFNINITIISLCSNPLRTMTNLNWSRVIVIITNRNITWITFHWNKIIIKMIS